MIEPNYYKYLKDSEKEQLKKIQAEGDVEKIKNFIGEYIFPRMGKHFSDDPEWRDMVFERYGGRRFKSFTDRMQNKTNKEQQVLIQRELEKISETIDYYKNNEPIYQMSDFEIECYYHLLSEKYEEIKVLIKVDEEEKQEAHILQRQAEIRKKKLDIIFQDRNISQSEKSAKPKKKTKNHKVEAEKQSEQPQPIVINSMKMRSEHEKLRVVEGFSDLFPTVESFINQFKGEITRIKDLSALCSTEKARGLFLYWIESGLIHNPYKLDQKGFLDRETTKAINKRFNIGHEGIKAENKNTILNTKNSLLNNLDNAYTSLNKHYKIPKK